MKKLKDTIVNFVYMSAEESVELIAEAVGWDAICDYIVRRRPNIIREHVNKQDTSMEIVIKHIKQ